MRLKNSFTLTAFCTLFILCPADAQQPQRGNDDGAKAKDFGNSSIVTRMMAFNKKNDGKLTRDEVTDQRLLRLFDEADTDKDGVVTKEELIALAAKKEAQMGQGGNGGRGQGGPGGPGGPGGGPGGPGGGPGGPGGPGGGPGGPGGRGGPPQPGQILPPFVRDMLKLTPDQKKQLDALQKDVDAKLAKILTPEQRDQLKEMRDRGPGPGGRGGPGGPGGPGGQGGQGGFGPPPKKDN